MAFNQDDHLRSRSDVVEFKKLTDGRYHIIDDVGDEFTGPFQDAIDWLEAGYPNPHG